MFENLVLSLKITLIGMSMVFGAIMLIWGLMTLLVRFAGKSTPDASDESTLTELERERLAAVAAVMVALAQQADSMQLHEFPLPPTALVSPWQAIMRTRILNKRGRVK
jgi:Na+-transporting methylmalonyl-CoA/oxaloacetate decarboxylase gamma subunit